MDKVNKSLPDQVNELTQSLGNKITNVQNKTNEINQKFLEVIAKLSTSAKALKAKCNKGLGKVEKDTEKAI